jgi:hypothetical protein
MRPVHEIYAEIGLKIKFLFGKAREGLFFNSRSMVPDPPFRFIVVFQITCHQPVSVYSVPLRIPAVLLAVIMHAEHLSQFQLQFVVSIRLGRMSGAILRPHFFPLFYVFPFHASPKKVCDGFRIKDPVLCPKGRTKSVWPQSAM